jgi:hypothetical protein
MTRIFPRFDGRGLQMRAPTRDRSHEKNRNGEDGVELAGSSILSRRKVVVGGALPLPACWRSVCRDAGNL